MAYDVKFLRGTVAGYEALSSKDNKTFYFVTDANEGKGALYLGDMLLSNTPEVEAVKAIIGSEDFSSIGKTVSAALNQLNSEIKKNQEAGEIKISTDSTTEGVAKSYTVTQGEKTIGVIDIPKDMVVQSGEVVVNPDGQVAGTYICLTLANTTNDKLYIDVAKLVDVYTAKASAAEVQLAFNGYEVSASLVDGGISTVKIADAAITTAKIADKNVTKAKLAEDVQASLDKADSAVQSITIGTANGEISVDGKAVKVYGLGTAAYENTDAFDAAGAAEEVKNELLGAETEPGAETIRGVKAAVETEVSNRETAVAALEKKVDEALGDGGNVATQIETAINKLDSTKAAAEGKAISSITQVDGVITEIAEFDVAGAIATAKQAAIDTAATDATSKANQALTDAKKYADEALTWGTF